jgi:Xaa-Pro aminopeptidase
MDFTQFKMVNRHDRVQAITAEEFERRWKEAMKMMSRNKIDIMLVLECGSNGAGLWLAGDRAATYIVFPVKGDIDVIYETNKLFKSREGKEIFNRYPFPNSKFVDPSINSKIKLTNTLDMESFRAKLVSDKSPRIGIVHMDALTIGLRNKFMNEFPDAELVDITVEFDRRKAIKSDFEMELLAESARLNQKVMEAVPAILREGRLYKEITDELQYLIASLGSSGEHMISMLHVFDSEGNSATPITEECPGTRAKKGDLIAYLLETNGPGGYYMVSGRVFSFGEPSEEFKRKYRIAVDANQLAGKMLRTGTTLRNIADIVNEFIRNTGYTTDNCNFLHSLGYSSWERLSLGDYSHNPEPEPTENDILFKNAEILTHPHVGFKHKYTSRSEAVRCIDTYYVSDEGGVRLNNLSQDIFIL